MEGGGLERQDVIAKMWRYVRGKLGNKRAYKLLRKTASTTLASHPIYGRYTQYFLCHAAATVADKHYIKPSQEQFDEAVKWLGKQFAVLWKHSNPVTVDGLEARSQSSVMPKLRHSIGLIPAPRFRGRA